MHYFTNATTKRQYFRFPLSVMEFFVQNVHGQYKIKFDRSCKAVRLLHQTIESDNLSFIVTPESINCEFVYIGTTYVLLHMNILKTSLKIFVQNEISVIGNSIKWPNILELVFGKPKKLRLIFGRVSIEWIKRISQSVIELQIVDADILDENGSALNLIDILEYFENLKVISWIFPKENLFNRTVVEKMTNSNTLSKLSSFELAPIHPTFDIENFANFITSHPQINFDLNFIASGLSDEKKQLIKSLQRNTYRSRFNYG